ncbi:MAG: ABC transporter permease [Chryseolinea sp.]
MRYHGPPKIFHAFFRWYCKPSVLQNIEGDLLEIYHERVKTLGRNKANLKFIIQVLQLFRPTIIRPFRFTSHITSMSMYKNYLKTAWRNLIKNKAFSAINISGLSLGLTCSILIGLWVYDEMNVDAFHADIDRIFIITSVEYSGTEVAGSYDTPGLLGEELPKVLPEVEFASSYTWISYNTFASGEKKMKLPGNFAGEDFFKIFSYPLIEGTKDNALKTPESIVISRKMANNFFGSPEAALDKTLRFETYKDLKVTGVFEDLGDNVSDKFEYLISWQLNVERNPWMKDWSNSGPTTFLKIRKGASSRALESKLKTFLKNYDKDYSEMERLELGIQPFSEHYLHSNFKGGVLSGGRIEYVNLFKIVAIFILVIACVNFMNLSTARAVKRAKEIGVRKSIGALRLTLMSQFTIEAFLFTSLAVFLALSMITLLLPSFNLLTGKNIESPLSALSFWIRISLLTFFTGMLAGSYPAVVLSSFKPAAVLKTGLKLSASSGAFRKGLVIFQFALAMILIVGMIVIARQVDFIQNTNLGYQKNNLIFVSISGDMASKFETFKDEALHINGITDITKTDQRPIDVENSTASVEWEGKDPSSKPTFTQMAIGYDFIKTLQADLKAGRDFSRDFNDSANFIINETALKTIGYEDPIGMPLEFWHVKGKIVGVMKDFHFASLHVPIRPLVLRRGRDEMWGWVLIRIEPGKTNDVVPALETLHNKYSPNVPFAYQFADEEYGALYQSEQVVKKLSRYFAGLAIFISCMGLLGLVIFTSEQRSKEVSIRKVLGANVSQIITLLSRDFMRLVLIATVISFPVDYYVMQQWLGGFQYHIDIEWWMFAIAGSGAIAIALVTVIVQAIKAAIANPVNNLKTE